MKDSYDLCDFSATDGAAVMPVEQGLATLQTGDHVVAGTQETVSLLVHADGTVPVLMT